MADFEDRRGCHGVFIFYRGVCGSESDENGKQVKSHADSILTLPMVLPPTVMGFYCLSSSVKTGCLEVF